jgi:hypothetical protein
MKNGLVLIFLILSCVVWTPAQPAPAPAADKKVAAAQRSGFAVPPDKAQPMRVTRFEKPPVIDGKLEDEVWSQAAVFKDFLQIDPGDNIAPSKSTIMLAGYDSKYIYFAFKAEDEPGKVQATVARRDNIFNDDYVGFFLDTFNDRRKAYALFFNPLGIQADGILTEGRGEDYSIDILMESKGAVTENGYVVEIAIPFKSLRYEAGKDKSWGVHFFRRIKRFNNELDSWMPMKRGSAGTLNQAGHITGMEGISVERTIEVIPSLTVSETGRRVRTVPNSLLASGATDPGRFRNEPVKVEPGLTAKLGLTPTITLDLALNPDFAQVEADEIVVTTNQRFPIFFEERRPFFLEGIDIFQSSLTPVHTRAIVDPDVAVKLSGKRGRNTFGLMVASDNAPGNLSEDDREELRLCQFRQTLDPRIDCANERIVDKNAYIGVLRLKRDIGTQSTLGFTATTYNFIQRHNDLAGVDGRFVIDPQTIFDFQVLGTTSRRFFFDPVLGSNQYRTGNGFAYNWVYDVTKRNYGWFVGGLGRSRDYRSDVGFSQRNNTNRANAFFRVSTDPKTNATFVGYRGTSFVHLNYDFQGRNQMWEWEFQNQFNFKNQSYIGIGYERAYERLFEEEFGAIRLPAGPGRPDGRPGRFFGPDSERSSHKNHYFFYAGTRPSQQWQIEYYTNYRDGAFDFDFGAGPKYPRVSPAALLFREAIAAGLCPSASICRAPLDPGAGGLLEMGLYVLYQPISPLRLTLDYTRNRLRRYDTGLTAFDVNLVTLRGTYQFTRATFTRARVDYDSVRRSLQGQFLLGWTPNPGTAFYLGYNDDTTYNGYNPFSENLEQGFRRNGRTFFIKMAYLFRRSF